MTSILKWSGVKWDTSIYYYVYERQTRADILMHISNLSKFSRRLSRNSIEVFMQGVFLAGFLTLQHKSEANFIFNPIFPRYELKWAWILSSVRWIRFLSQCLCDGRIRRAPFRLYTYIVVVCPKQITFLSWELSSLCACKLMVLVVVRFDWYVYFRSQLLHFWFRVPFS